MVHGVTPMADLRAELQKNLEQQIDELERKLSEAQKTRDALSGVDLENATFTVSLGSLWASEGETSTETCHTGTLQSAIEKAETDFMARNNRSDVQADYIVYLHIGDTKIRIPEEGHKNYMGHYKKK